MYTAPVSLMVTGIIDFDTHGCVILDLDVVIENCNNRRQQSPHNNGNRRQQSPQRSGSGIRARVTDS